MKASSTAVAIQTAEAKMQPDGAPVTKKDLGRRSAAPRERRELGVCRFIDASEMRALDTLFPRAASIVRHALGLEDFETGLRRGAHYESKGDEK